MKMKTAAMALLMSSGMATAEMSVQLSGGWDGARVPAGQQCKLHGGNGSTPPMQVSGIPQGTKWIIADFNDLSYQPLSKNGGHGRIGFPVSGSTAKLPAVPGMTAKLPAGAQVIKAARGKGKYASPGYLPPCSGGRGNRYSVDLRAVDGAGKVLETLSKVAIGKY